MIPGPFSLQAMAREAEYAARVVARRGALAAAQGLIGLVGAGFVIFAGYAALRPVFGPALAALTVGVVLLAFAVYLSRLVGSLRPAPPPPLTVADPPRAVVARPPPDPLTAEGAVTMAVFTAAFMLGRRLADRRRDRPAPPRKPGDIA